MMFLGLFCESAVLCDLSLLGFVLCLYSRVCGLPRLHGGSFIFQCFYARGWIDDNSLVGVKGKGLALAIALRVHESDS